MGDLLLTGAVCRTRYTFAFLPANVSSYASTLQGQLAELSPQAASMANSFVQLASGGILSSAIPGFGGGRVHFVHMKSVQLLSAEPRLSTELVTPLPVMETGQATIMCIVEDGLGASAMIAASSAGAPAVLSVQAPQSSVTMLSAVSQTIDEALAGALDTHDTTDALNSVSTASAMLNHRLNASFCTGTNLFVSYGEVCDVRCLR